MPPYRPPDFEFRIATTPFELEGFWRLRHTVFCGEQGIFHGTDRDENDLHMIPIVCVSLMLGMVDQVVGTVRIEERTPGIWWGSRLAVDRSFRYLRHLSPGVAQRNHHPEVGLSLGAGLIYKAVTTAHALGCREFYASVQAQNARLFERLHWRPLARTREHGLPHVTMQAELEWYPPASAEDLPTRSAVAS